VLKWFVPFVAVAFALAVAVLIHRHLLFAAKATVVPTGYVGFKPNWISPTKGSKTQPGLISSVTNEVVQPSGAPFHPLVVSTNQNQKIVLRPEGFVEARLRVSMQTVSVAFVLAVLVSLTVTTGTIWSLRLKTGSPALTWLALVFPLVGALAVWWFYSRNPNQYLDFTVDILRDLNTAELMSTPVPKIDWLVLCHAIAFACALAFCSVSAVIIAQTSSGASEARLITSLDAALYLGTAVLGLCVLFEKTFYDWLASFYVRDKAQHEAFQALASSFLVATGLMGSLFVASYYVPAVLALKRVSGTFELKNVIKVKNAFAVTGPLLVGGIAKVLDILGSFGT